MNASRLPVLAVVVAVVGCGQPAVASPSPATPPTTTPKRATPCFPDQPALSASRMYKALEKYAWSLYAPETEAPPKASYGSCTVEKNVVRDARGRTVAELGCGVRILVRGIRDDLGLEIGARGRRLLAHPKRPKTQLVCRGNGPEQAWCRFDRNDDNDTDHDAYVVAGTLGEDVLTGTAAERFLAERTIVEIHTSVWCH